MVFSPIKHLTSHPFQIGYEDRKKVIWKHIHTYEYTNKYTHQEGIKKQVRETPPMVSSAPGPQTVSGERA